MENGLRKLEAIITSREMDSENSLPWSEMGSGQDFNAPAISAPPPGVIESFGPAPQFTPEQRSKAAPPAPSTTVDRAPSMRQMLHVVGPDSEGKVSQQFFDMAFSNIKIGVSLWDVRNNLVLANRRFFDITELNSDIVTIGMNFVDYSELVANRGAMRGLKPNEILGSRMSVVSRGKDVSYDEDWPNGKIISVEHRHIGNGFWLMTYEDITDRKQAQSQVAYLANHDPLTRLGNRNYFMTRFKEVLSRKIDVAMFYIDLDKFKEVNDTMGHPCGDVVLRLVSRRLASCFRQDDIVCRLGGDEFAVIVSSARTREQVSSLARRVINLLSEPFDVDGRKIAIGASIGIVMSSEDGSDHDELLKRADLALYNAKDSGRGMSCFFEVEMERSAMNRRLLEDDLRLAIDRNQLQLFYQPIVNARTRKVAGYEALMRWNHPTMSFVSPVDFIPIAELSGLINSIGSWALRRACSDAAKWSGGRSVAVNLSAVQFGSPTIIRDIGEAILFSNLEPSRLEIEITESVLIKDAARAKELMHEMKKLGVRISIDDFGTGYSSLSYLKDFEFDKVKIDKAFVDSLGNNRVGDAIVRAVTHLADDIGMSVVAEGVETEFQLEWLKAEKCAQVQGYLFSKPRPCEELDDIVARIEGQA